jgi:hypothetical protein
MGSGKSVTRGELSKKLGSGKSVANQLEHEVEIKEDHFLSGLG